MSEVSEGQQRVKVKTEKALSGEQLVESCIMNCGT